MSNNKSLNTFKPNYKVSIREIIKEYKECYEKLEAKSKRLEAKLKEAEKKIAFYEYTINYVNKWYVPKNLSEDLKPIKKYKEG